MRHIQGESRRQTTLLPDRLEDYVPDDHPVRVIDAFIESLDLVALKFTLAKTRQTGRKPYNPADLLKLYVYGYLNQIRSSRKLEKECQRNLELMWLMRRLAPDFKTIANFRKQNAGAIKGACHSFIQFCREAELVSVKRVAIDGSKFKSAASLDQTITRKQLETRRRRLNARIESYLKQLNAADQSDNDHEMRVDKVKEALTLLEQHRETLNQRERWMDEHDSNQHCATEPEARIMRSGREGKICGYNLQSAVDSETGLIVHHELTRDAADNCQLQPVAEAVKAQQPDSRLMYWLTRGIPMASSLTPVKSKG